MFQLLLATVACLGATVCAVEHTNVCHFYVDNKCELISLDYADIFDRGLAPCSRQDIPKDIYYTVMEKNGSASQGVLNVGFEAPGLLCEYKMVLFINPAISNAQDCSKYRFDSNSNASMIHTHEKNLCLSEPSSCRNNWLAFYYQYVYNGCYAVAFVVDAQYMFMKQEFLTTGYNKTQLPEAIYRCTYRTTAKSNGSSLQSVSIGAEASLLTGPVGLKLEIAAASPLFQIVGDKNACNRDELPIITHRFAMSVTNNYSLDQSCSVASSLSPTGESIKNVDCKFTIDNAPADRGYCLIIRILDARCHRNTVWDPPVSRDMSFPCSWKQYCQKLEAKQALREKVNESYDGHLRVPSIFYSILGLLVLALAAALFILYRRRSKRLQVHHKNGHSDEEASTILELNGSRSHKEKLVKQSGIVLLYVKESDNLMNLMLDLRTVLEKHTGCDVYDWWAAEFWNDVAYLGGYDWITNLMRNDYRVIWMDTPRSRILAASPRKNGLDKLKASKTWRNNHEAVDFRDNIYPTVVDFAKRSNQKLQQEYQRYFVVRLETFASADKTEDPFADLSPHARYLVPCHLDRLCCQLSSTEPYQDEMNSDKARLRNYLAQESVVALEPR